MGFRTARSLPVVAALFLLAGALAVAQNAPPGVDFSGLTAAQKAKASKVLTDQPCSCGCGMKIAECRVKDPSCSYSQGLASIIVQSLKKGETEEQAIAAAKSSQFAQGPADNSRVLGDPVKIPVDGAPVTGPEDAPITVVEFSDFQCPYCVAAVPNLQALLKAYPTTVRLIFKQFPLDIHSRAAYAATAAVAAQKQGKFWPMHDALFANHQNLSAENVSKIASGLGLDMKRFEADLHSAAVEQTVQQDIKDGDTVGVQGTPTIFVNGQRYNGPIQMDSLRPLFDAELKVLKPEAKATGSSSSSAVSQNK